MDTYKKFKVEQNILRIIVFITGIGMTAYCGLLCCGVRHCVAEISCLTLGYILLCGGAWIFKLCWLSWAFIFYSYAIRLCIILRDEGVFDGTVYDTSVLDIAHYATFLVGLVLTLFFFLRIRKYLRVFDTAKKL